MVHRGRGHVWRTVVAAVAFGVVAPALGGCSFDGATPARPVAVALNQIAPHQRDAVGRGGALNWPVPAIPASLNAYHADGGRQPGAAVNEQVLRAVLPHAYDVDASGAPVWNRDLLAAAPALVAGPEQVVTYRLNPKAAWSDGTPVTWADLYWQWRACSGTPGYAVAGTAGYEDIREVARGRDDREAVVRFARRYADWRSLFGPVYPAATTRDPVAFNTGWRDRAGATAGPFRIAGIDRAGGTLTLVRDDSWWGDRAKLDRIVYRVVGEAGLVDAYLDGTVDFVDAGADADRYGRARSGDGGETRRAVGGTFRVLTFNGAGPVLSDVAVRRALARAVDRAAMARAALGPLGVQPRLLNNHLFLAGQDGYRDNSGELGRHDPAAAGRMLDAAGWRRAGEVRVRDGRPLELSMVVPAGMPATAREAEAVRASLGRVGVPVKITEVPAAEFFDGYLAAGRFDLAVFSWHGTGYPTSMIRSIYGRPVRDPTGLVDIRQNYARVGSAELDALLVRAAGELDPGRSVELGNRIDAAIWQEVHSLPLYQLPNMVVARRKLANFGARGLATLRYQDIGWLRA